MMTRRTLDLAGDLEALSRDVQHLAEDVEGEVALAEYIGATELAGSVGIVVEALQQLQVIAEEQLHLALDDHQALAEALLERKPLPEVLQDIERATNRRLAHLTTGCLDFIETMGSEQVKLWNNHVELWDMFFRSIWSPGTR